MPADAAVHWVLSTPAAQDAPPAPGVPEWTYLTGPRGLTAQRNTALDWLPEDADYVFFFDDDALPEQDYLVAAVAHFAEVPQHVAITGTVLLDGAALKHEVAYADAVVALAAQGDGRHPAGHRPWTPTRELYGCNFAVRWRAVRDLRFEERFPLYGWLEDLDYSGQVRRRGGLARLEAAKVVHRGVTSGGRTQHIRMGYSTVANPAWMVRKGTLSLGSALVKAGRPMLRNLLGLLLPGEREWRLQRIRGNGLAVGDLIAGRGRARPERILEL